MNIHVYPTGPDSVDAARRVARGGDTILMHEGIYDLSLDTYDGPIQGGTSWGTKLVIRAYKPRGKPPEKVTLRPEGGQYVVRFAEAAASYIELRNLDLDASLVELMAIKLSRRGGLAANAAHHVRFVECDIHGAKWSGAHGNEVGMQFIRCRIWGNGSHLNLDHGLYLGGPDSLVQDCDLFSNCANGVKIYNGDEPICDRAVVRGNRCWDNAAGGRIGSGIFVSTGKDQIVEWNYCAGNDIGIRVYKESSGVTIKRNVLGPVKAALPGQITGRIYVEDGATGTVLGTGVDANLEVA